LAVIHTWGVEIGGEKKSKKFEFKVRKISEESIFSYTIEKKL